MKLPIKKTIVTFIIISIYAFCVFSTTTFADVFEIDSDTYKPEDSKVAEGVGKTAASVLGVVQLVSMTIAIVTLMMVGIKYVAAAPEGKAELKKKATIYVVGAVLLFGATAIVGIIKEVAKNSL